jgi:hypothetical protein
MATFRPPFTSLPRPRDRRRTLGTVEFVPNPSQNHVVWDRGSQFLVVTGGGPNTQINSVLLQGTSTRSVSIKEAYAVSGLTGHKQELMAVPVVRLLPAPVPR